MGKPSGTNAKAHHGAGSDSLMAEFERRMDELVAQMQTRESKSAVKSLFSAGPDELGRAAVAAARGRKKRRG